MTTQRDDTPACGTSGTKPRTRGLYEGRPLLLRQLTAVSGSQAMSLVFRFIEPADEQALLAESSSIAAGWRLAGER